MVLLNSDTTVHGDWLDRLRKAAGSAPKVATVNPLTNASHISCYPFSHPNSSVNFEVDDATLDKLAAEANRGRRVAVDTTVGFCMYIRRAALDELGLFDGDHFPRGYCEETDFCYRAGLFGWLHLVTGDAFVRHWEGQSFGPAKQQILADMTATLTRLHPGWIWRDRRFAERDPLRSLRAALDLARAKRLLDGTARLACVAPEGVAALSALQPALTYDAPSGAAALLVPNSDTFPNLPRFALPADIVSFNTMLSRLGATRLHFATPALAEAFRARLKGLDFELGLAPSIALSSELWNTRVSF